VGLLGFFFFFWWTGLVVSVFLVFLVFLGFQGAFSSFFVYFWGCVHLYTSSMLGAPMLFIKLL
jgi:hypothetical protein